MNNRIKRIDMIGAYLYTIAHSTVDAVIKGGEVLIKTADDKYIYMIGFESVDDFCKAYPKAATRLAGKFANKEDDDVNTEVQSESGESVEAGDGSNVDGHDGHDGDGDERDHSVSDVH